ncbi:MAG: heterodisulfide reductase-related iron-sulfur binding cluster [Desulfobacterales bacterium]|nr:heterodisulfide reductase-related iron-sulfur binding cluster [Desulfobacterales bacterium]
MATSALENNLSLIELTKKLGINLVEIEDWNCCGSSSTHSVNTELALYLASRNLSLAQPDRPLLVACPSCNLRLRHARHHLKKDKKKRDQYEDLWGQPFNPNLEIIHFFELLDEIDFLSVLKDAAGKLNGLKFTPYYGCMLARPPEMRFEKNYHGLMERILSSVGAEPMRWSHASNCCGTFLSVSKPKAVTPIVNGIIQNAMDSGAQCVVTACSMCHLNLEVRCNLKAQIPTMHFSELLCLALGTSKHKQWFSRHLVDPRPLLRSIDLIK